MYSRCSSDCFWPQAYISHTHIQTHTIHSYTTHSHTYTNTTHTHIYKHTQHTQTHRHIYGNEYQLSYWTKGKNLQGNEIYKANIITKSKLTIKRLMKELVSYRFCFEFEFHKLFQNISLDKYIQFAHNNKLRESYKGI
jgi:hypothetical protein